MESSDQEREMPGLRRETAVAQTWRKESRSVSLEGSLPSGQYVEMK